MNLEREREAFESKYPHKKQLKQILFNSGLNMYLPVTSTTFQTSVNDTVADCVNTSWLMWLASANREGCKLAPVEPTQEMIYAGESAEHKGCISVAVVYKAMIGAVE